VTDQDPDDSEAEFEEFEDEAPAATPFDNPYFLPAVLWGLAGWFGFDIVTNAQAYQDYPNFNRGGFGVLSLLAIYFTRSAILEKRALREKDPDLAAETPSDTPD
jgi:hypothetical protein